VSAAGRPAATPRAPAGQPPGRWRALWASGRPGALLAALALGAALAYGLGAETFDARRLEVTGAPATGAEQIAATGGVLGHNIFTIDPQVVAARLATLPTVREVQVWTELPDRLVVEVVERQGALVWQAGGARFLLDPSGFVIAANPPEARARGLPVVRATARDGGPPRVGGWVDDAAVRAVMAAVRLLSREYPLRVTGLEYAPETGLVLLGDAGWRVILGDDRRMAEKLAVCAALLKGERTWQTLDVTDPERPVTTERR
jgi:cell division protein FtsQ